MARLRKVALACVVGAAVTVLVASQMPAASSEAAPAQPGSAFASATVIGVNPQYGGLSLAVRGGESTASYTATQAVADSQALNLGYIGGLAGSSATGALNELEGSSAAGASKASADGGVETVTVNPSPESAGAVTALAPVSVPGVLSVTASAASNVNYSAGQYQEADASTTMGLSLLGGLVTLNGLVWSAKQETGTTSASDATFSMASVTIAGKTTTIAGASQLTSVVTLVNKVLTVAGLKLTLPAETTDPVTGTVTIGALQLELTGTALTNKVLGALNSSETALELQIGKLLGSGDVAAL
ncbi:MAG TPA: hypothetical protein VL961_10730, partial [Acidimicrobiales bacterium]|nr:hypothetical protein [Acidimicrobiales bacterium]